MKKAFIKAGVALLAVSAVACCEVALRRRRRAWSPCQRKNITAPADASSYRDAIARVTDGIKKYAGEFDGLYEGLYQAAKNQQMFSTDAYEEWCSRAEQMADESFRSAFGGLFRKSDVTNEVRCRCQYQLLLDCIAAAGITRDRDGGMSCLADDSLRMAYVGAEGKPPQIGERCTVIKPAWVSGKKVIEYGIVFPETVEPCDTGREEIS